MKKLQPVVLLVVAFASSGAFAQNRGFYATADVGVARGEGEYRGGSAVNYVATSVKDDSNAFRVRAGYQFATYIGMEVGYADLGDFAFDNGPANCPPSIPVNCDFTTHASARGPFSNVIFFLPAGERLRFKGIAGLYLFQFETRESGPDASANPARGTDSESGSHWGVTAALRVGEKAEVEVGYTRFSAPGFAQMGAPGAAHFEPSDVDVISLGVSYRF
jgi:hypothetical protein